MRVGFVDKVRGNNKKVFFGGDLILKATNTDLFTPSGTPRGPAGVSHAFGPNFPQAFPCWVGIFLMCSN